MGYSPTQPDARNDGEYSKAGGEAGYPMSRIGFSTGRHRPTTCKKSPPTSEPIPMAGKHIKVGRNEPCPCGSGKKHQACCYDKDFDYVQEADGNLFRRLPVKSEVQAILQERREQFRAEHGCDPGPDDLVFGGEPEHVEHEIVLAMKKAGIDPALICAFERTGLLVTEKNQNLISEADLAEWNRAIDEFHARS